MRKGEKILSFVKYEKEIESDYRRALEDTKRPDEIHKVFREYAFKILKNVKKDIKEDMIDYLKLTPNSEEHFSVGDELTKLLGKDLLGKSDLLAILGRMAISAAHRYIKLKRDDERTDLFRLGEGSKAH